MTNPPTSLSGCAHCGRGFPPRGIVWVADDGRWLCHVCVEATAPVCAISYATCAACAGVFLPTRRQLGYARRGGRIFCSVQCRHQAKRRRLAARRPPGAPGPGVPVGAAALPCAHCARRFVPTTWQRGAARRGHPLYCTRHCYGLAKRRRAARRQGARRREPA